MAAVTRKEQKDATTAKMKATAAGLFRQRGYEHVTIRDVAAAAGMSTGAVFSTFQDKDDMFLKSMDREAPNQARLTSFLNELAQGGDSYLAARAKELLADLYGEQPQ